MQTHQLDTQGHRQKYKSVERGHVAKLNTSDNTAHKLIYYI